MIIGEVADDVTIKVASAVVAEPSVLVNTALYLSPLLPATVNPIPSTTKLVEVAPDILTNVPLPCVSFCH